MNKVFLLSTALLTGCAATPPLLPPVITQMQIVKVKVPEALLIIPPKVAPISLTGATQKNVAQWIIDNDLRQQIMEENLNAIKKNNN